MTQLDLFAYAPSVVERLAQAARQRIVDGVVDEWGRHRPDGPRMLLTEPQQRAYNLAVRGGLPPGADNAGTLG